MWEPITLNREGPRLSHLLFANDLVLFGKASLEQVKVIKGILDIFCKSSGQKINFAKSCVCFSKNVHGTKRQEISDALGIWLTSDLGKYLGVPFFHEKCSKRYFQYIIDKMTSKLNS